MQRKLNEHDVDHSLVEQGFGKEVARNRLVATVFKGIALILGAAATAGAAQLVSWWLNR